MLCWTGFSDSYLVIQAVHEYDCPGLPFTPTLPPGAKAFCSTTEPESPSVDFQYRVFPDGIVALVVLMMSGFFATSC